MKKKFRFLEDVALADIAFEAYGKTVEELFENAALALEEVMVDTKTILKSKYQISKIHIKNQKLEDLLFDFLEELVFLKDAKQILFSKITVKIKLDARRYTLNANLYGEKINPKKHKLKTDVKAVTRHLFSLKKEKDLYKARVVLDI